MMKFFTQPFALLWKFRQLLYNTTCTDVRSRYAGTTLGMAWLAIYPLLFLSLYAVVYVAIYKVRFGEMKPFEYVLLIFAALIPFLNFIEVLGLGVSSVTSNSALIKNTIFPIELIPVKSVLSCLPSLLIGLSLLEIALIVTGNFSVIQFTVVFAVLLQTIFSIGLCWILSALNVFMKDLAQIVPLLSLALMLVSPIAYTTDMVPERLQIFMYFNPLFFLIDLYRSAMLGMPVSWLNAGIFTAISLFIFWVGFSLFTKLKKVFSDEC